MDPIIAVRGLTKQYPAVTALDDVSLEVRPGEVFGLLGPNGAGKTTLMRCILDLVRPEAGAITLLGRDWREPTARAALTYLPGELSLPPRLTGDQVVRRYTLARGGARPERIRSLAERLALDLRRPVGELSKGNRQKLGLVLAFAPEARLLLLDEPTSGLDPLLQREFADLVGEAVADGAAVLLSSHVLGELETLADRIAVLRKGRVVIIETVDELRRRARQRLRVRFADAAATAACATALLNAGAVHVDVAAEWIDFTVTGDIDGAIKALAGFHIEQLQSVGNDLEDIFLELYTNGGAA